MNEHVTNETATEIAGDAGVLAEMAALRHRLAALEARLPGNAPEQPPGRQAKRRTSPKTVAWLTTGAVLAILAGASVVYGAVDAFFISKEGNVGIGTSTPQPANKLEVNGRIAAKSLQLLNENTNANGATLVLGPTSTSHLQLGYDLEYSWVQSHALKPLAINPLGNNVGIGTATPNADNKLEVNGKIAATSLNVDGNASVKTMSAPDQSVKIEGASGRNMFSDSEKAGNLRVGALWGIPGIYSQKGDVAVGSESGNIQLKGNVKVDGAVDGNMKVVYQRDDDPQKTYEKPLWRYHMSLTAAKYAGGSKTIPKETLKKLCGTADGCEVRLGMTRWDADSKTQTASISFRFYYSPEDGHWRTSDSAGGAEGVIADGAVQHAANGWNSCFFTDGTFDKGNGADKGTGMQLHVSTAGVKNAARTCELTLIP